MIISYLFGPEEVTNYNIVYRYFSIIMVVFGVVMAPFWTAFTDAYQKKDFLWISKTMQTLLLLVGLSVLGSIMLYIFANDIYRLWIDGNIKIPNELSALMALYVVLFGLMNVFAFFSNGIGKIRMQMLINTLTAIINIPLSYYLGYVLEWGVNGVLLATIICIILLFFT